MTEQTTPDEKFMQIKRVLQAFQQKRLLTTYTDLIENPEYTQIARFFFEKLYAPEDFTFRNASIQKLHKVLKGSVPKGMVSAIEMVFELHELSDTLDDKMVEKMIAHGIGPDFSPDDYQEIYRRLDNYDQRLYQIKLTARTASAFHRLSKMWIVGVSLKTVRRAARILGMSDIIDFVHEGYVGFRTIDDIRYLVGLLEQRETDWHNTIWNSGGG
jgi:hypothetical protein